MSKSNAKSTSKSSSASASAAAAAPEPIDEKSSPTVIALYDIDDFSAHHCGYCNQNGNISIGMSCEIMRIEDYQTLIDRGWRRSGTYIYKPTMDKTCCPLYTIKCDSANIELRKSQKNTLKTMRRYLENEQKKKKTAASSASTSNSSSQPSKQEKQQNQSKNLIKITPVHKSAQKAADKTNAQKVMEYILSHDLTEIKSEQKPEKLMSVDKLKSKQKRLFRKLIRLKEANKISSLTDIEKYLKRLNRLKSNDEMSLEKYLKVDEGGKSANKLEIKLVRSWPPSKEFENTLNEEHKLYTKYQTVIHRDSPLECSMSQFKRFLCTSPLIKGSYSGPLASNLSKAALNSVDKSICGDIDAIGYGSFHQQYRVNGKLIGVGVIDILNDCVSSVYFFYDPEFQFLNMGTYSALREIAFTRQINKLDSNIKWYYLGFYAHSCRKMRYKGFFHPSYLLCPETYTWHSIEKCVELLDKSKYSRFASASEVDQDRASENIDDIKIRIKFKDNNMRVFPFKEFCTLLNSSFVPQFTHLVSGYCQLFGKKFSNNVLIKF